MGSEVTKKTLYAVLLSSTYVELVKHREVVRSAMLGQRLMPVAMEDDAVVPDKDLISASLSKVEESDAYVGLISYRYGQAPDDCDRNPDELSLTELEFRRAVDRKIPICMFIMHDDHPVPRRAVGAERETQEKYDAFVKLAKRGRIYAEFTSVDDLKAKAVQSLVELRRVLETSAAPRQINGDRANRNAISNIPINVPLHFLGRDEELAAIDAALKRYDGRVAITALHGLRGVGKTTLAAAYAERHRGDYGVTWWVKAQTEATMRADLVGLGVRLKWVAADENHESALAAVMDRLRTEAEGVLLIYDNASDAAALRSYLPRGGAARVLITSNAHAWRGTAEPVEIQLWPKEIGAEYLIARTGREQERDAAERLSIALGGLPLAHEQASAYCEWLDMPLEDYHARFEATPVKFLDDKRHAPAEYHDGLTVAKTFALAIDEAAKLHPAAEPFIVLAALLAPEPIPLYLFSEGREKLGEPLASALEGDGLVEAVATLRAFALIDRETIVDKRNQPATTNCIRLHRLVREVASAKVAVVQTRVDTVERLIRVLAAIYPDNGYSESKDWPRCSQLLPHGMFICREANATGIEIGELPQLLDGLANYLNGIAAYREGEPLYHAALSLGKKILGASHPKIGIWLNNLGNLLLNTARYSEAEPVYLEAIRIGEQGPEQNTVGIATRKNNLAILYTDVGQYDRAEALFSEAIASTREVLGPRNRVMGTRLFNLANLYKRTGQSGKAEALYREAISIGEEVSGREDNRVSTWIAGLADVLRDTGRWEEAEALYREAIENTQKIFSEGNPNLGAMRLEYSKLLLVSGHLDRALDEANQSLETKQRVYGDENPWTVNAARTTAQVMQALGRANDARSLREKYGISDE
jgi:tetratricopeptide (TPR) repeat protein